MESVGTPTRWRRFPFRGDAHSMKKLLLFAIAAVGLYLAWIRFGPPRAAPRASSGDTTPAANARQRIDNLSGAAPPE
jgi:hypothetical protein